MNPRMLISLTFTASHEVSTVTWHNTVTCLAVIHYKKKTPPKFSFHLWSAAQCVLQTSELNPSSTNQVVPGCDKLSQKVENSSTFCNKICTGCAFYWPKAKSFCSRWFIYRVLRDSCLILANKKSVLTQHATNCTYTWCYLLFKFSQNEIWKFGRNLLLAKFGSERVKELFLAVSMNIP